MKRKKRNNKEQIIEVHICIMHIDGVDQLLE